MRKLLDIVHQLQSGQIDPDQARKFVSSLSQQRQIDSDLAALAATFVQRQLAEEDKSDNAVWKSRKHYLETYLHRSSQSAEAASLG